MDRQSAHGQRTGNDFVPEGAQLAKRLLLLGRGSLHRLLREDGVVQGVDALHKHGL